MFVCGHGRHGKDTVAAMLAKMLDLKFVSSSRFMVSYVRPILRFEHGLTYESDEECYNDRHNHRVKWKLAIAHYNRNDKAWLARKLFEDHDIYVGMRSRREFLEARELADTSIWVDAQERRPTEDTTCTITPDDCDIYIDNNGDRWDLFFTLAVVAVEQGWASSVPLRAV